MKYTKYTKVGVFGDRLSGKTTLINLLIYNKFIDINNTSVGIDFFNDYNNKLSYYDIPSGNNFFNIYNTDTKKSHNSKRILSI